NLLDDPAASYIPTRSLVLDVGSPRALALARQHIDECVRGHAECCQSSVSTASLTRGRRLPKRLVDCTNLARPRGEYLALSYVWGNSEQAHQTTTSNVSAYEHGINPRMLPQTLRDAIRVTHMLGFRSLWVDSLCILQDSPEDKAQKINGMHHIYRNAQLTIMAAGAQSVDEGFLCRRDPLYNDDQYIADESEPPIPEDVALPFICPPRPATSMGTALWRSHGAELWRMSTRAWCLQEYLMSARALIFSPRTLLFKCLAGTRGVGGSLCAMFKEPRLPNTLFLPIPPEVEPGSKEWKDTHTAWLGVVKDYSRRSASVESDKLVACAAIAEQFHRALRSDYLAGLWRSDTLLTNLLWEDDKVESSMLGRRHTRPTVYRAPSWSWASLDGVIQQSNLYTMDFEDTQTVALAKVVECVVTLEDAALPFGRVTGGTLVLRGAL
ncbi:HET-domain-containing protein, partial [Trametes versicolor FP-101664 SS1]|uniref:HET-domain-containing protein n=1 Tax=Trametes versicolor (strain FP-101664) TaxID=717944 RepID=UPI0004621E71